MVKRTFYIAGGIIFIILGILGLFLPILQGILFLLIGFYLLSKGSATAHRYFEWMKGKFPKEAAYLRRVKARLLSYVSRVEE